MRFLIGAILSVAAFSAAAQLYRWTDESGKVHFTDTPPPPSARNVQKRSAPAAGGDAAKAGAGAPAEPFALQEARKKFPVTLYSTPGCEACDEARKLLNARGVPFKEVSITEESQMAELKSAVGSNSVPAMIVGSSVQKGFEDGVYHRILDAAGYPKSGILPPRAQTEPKPAEPKGEVKPAAPPPPLGPYAPGARR